MADLDRVQKMNVAYGSVMVRWINGNLEYLYALYEIYPIPLLFLDISIICDKSIFYSGDNRGGEEVMFPK